MVLSLRARWLVPLAALAAVWVGPAVRARACSCIQPPAPRVAAAEATAVFEGRTFGMHHESGQNFGKLRFSFEVTRVFKGELGAKVDVTTPASPAMCGRVFELGVQYIVYARAGEGGVLADSLCSRTRSSKNATEDFVELGAGVVPASAAAVGPLDAVVEPPRIEPGPPAATPSKRGCSIDAPAGIAPWLILAVLGLHLRRPLTRIPPRAPR